MQFPFSLLDLPRSRSQDMQQFLWLLSHVITLKTKAQELTLSHCNIIIHLIKLWLCHNVSRFGFAQSRGVALLIIQVPSPQSRRVAAAVPRLALSRPVQSLSWAWFHSCLHTLLCSSLLPLRRHCALCLPFHSHSPCLSPQGSLNYNVIEGLFNKIWRLCFN